MLAMPASCSPWTLLCRCRDNYAKVDLLGGERAVIKLHGKEYLRKDIRLVRKLDDAM